MSMIVDGLEDEDGSNTVYGILMIDVCKSGRCGEERGLYDNRPWTRSQLIYNQSTAALVD